ncbi:winged helix-turn-helix transcriptional regulator [Pseudomonas fluorescens]|uniref:winged helix-turn-helix transcriptional regulator n=1 Tax=Pseudomonas fluorescens TaxID=294 RepID=UPI0012428108|nr:helix-turn-helix domain-containing protein [Pseudomonas fluorescens]
MVELTRTHKIVTTPLKQRKVYTADTAATDVEAVFRLLRGRWKLLILFHLFDGKVQRFSDLERRVCGISQKMLAQQLRSFEREGLVLRTDYQEVPPRVDYRLTPWGQKVCPVMDSMLEWAEQRADENDLPLPVAASVAHA